MSKQFIRQMQRSRGKRLTPKQDALDTFMSLHSQIGAHLERLTQLHDDHFEADPDNITWGDVGTLRDVESKLHALCDMLFREGEHAPERN